MLLEAGTITYDFAPALHPALGFMLKDMGGSLWATVMFACVLLAPGYLVGYGLDVCRFRTRGAEEQLAWSLALSMGAGTLPLVALVWLGGITAAAAVIALAGLSAVVLFATRRGRATFPKRELRIGILIVCCWTTLVLLSLVDLGVTTRLWMSVTAYDHALRTAFVSAVMRTGVPPVNPLYWPGHNAPMRYYYFWYVLCGVVGKLAHVSARQALIASCVWPFFGMCAMLALFWRHVLGLTGRELRRRWAISVALMGVTGFDVLVVTTLFLAGQKTVGDMEWWAVDQVTSWLDSMLWVPHHVTALVCSLLCLLLVLRGMEEESGRRRLVMIGVGGLSLASGFGLSVYVPVACGMILAGWLVWQITRPESRRRAITLCVGMAAVASVILLPYLAQLRHGIDNTLEETTIDGGAQAPPVAQHVFGFGVRRIIGVDGIEDLGVFHNFASRHPHVFFNSVALVLLPLGYAVEFGFFGLALILICRRSDAGFNSRFKPLILFTFCGLACVTFIRSEVISVNDFASRGSLLPQFFLLLIGTEVLFRAGARAKPWLIAMIVVGACGSAYQLIALRIYLPWQQLHGNPDMYDLAERNADLRSVYLLAQKEISAMDRVQYNPDSEASIYLSKVHLLDLDHQLVATEGECGAAFGGERYPCAGILRELYGLFPKGEAKPASAMAAQAICSQLGIQYLVATKWDSAWRTQESWVWNLPAVASIPDARVVACSSPGSGVRVVDRPHQ